MDPSAAEELKRRTKQFGLRIIRLYRALPRNGEAQVIGRQLLRSGTSVGANYRAVCRARSSAEFVSKLGVVVEEADESLYWLEMLLDSGTVAPNRLSALMKEADELISIFVAGRQTARQSLAKSKFKIQNS
jgi:four helix bundle protein